ncbi:MAG TPA: acetyl-coenzyme A synthetase N-terminal domain-containing protein, partial [Sphingobium sp.]
MSPPPLIRTFHEFAEQRANRSFPDYEALHRWSVEESREFWSAVWDFDSIQSPEPPVEILTSEAMPGAKWFPGTKVNYARQVLRHADAAHAAGHPAIIAEDERGPVEVVDWPTLRRRVASFALA